MKKRFLLFIILLISIVATTTFFLIINYFDPFIAPRMAIVFIITTFLLGLSSILSLFLYFIKKIHYRGEVTIYHVKSSFRQGLFISLFILFGVVFKIFNAPMYLSLSALVMLFLFIELFIKNIES